MPGRLEPIDRGQGFLALVDYAHKPGRAARGARDAARADRQAGVAVVFGAGGNRDPGKREPMGRVAAELADLVVVTDDNPRDEDPAAIRVGDHGGRVGRRRHDVVEIGDRREAIDHAVAWARAGDVVLIAGKGHEAGQTSHGQTRPFDDRDELAAVPRGAGIPRMIDLTLAQIADIVGGELADISAADAAATRVTGTVEFDSRAVTPGGLFLALPGARSDGHDFAAGGGGRRCRRRCWPRGPSACPRSSSSPAPSPEPTRRPACSSTTPTARARPCSRRWPGWPLRWPPSWWRAA